MISRYLSPGPVYRPQRTRLRLSHNIHPPTLFDIILQQSEKQKDKIFWLSLELTLYCESPLKFGPDGVRTRTKLVNYNCLRRTKVSRNFFFRVNQNHYRWWVQPFPVWWAIKLLRECQKINYCTLIYSFLDFNVDKQQSYDCRISDYIFTSMMRRTGRLHRNKCDQSPASRWPRHNMP